MQTKERVLPAHRTKSGADRGCCDGWFEDPGLSIAGRCPNPLPPKRPLSATVAVWRPRKCR
jgi:hypothetical protein